MLFIETSVFTRLVKQLLSDDHYRLLQSFLATHPESGNVILDSGGLRKIRWSLESSSKRSGVRLIYYYQKSDHILYMIYIFKKSQVGDLTKSQIQQLKNLVKGLK